MRQQDEVPDRDEQPVVDVEEGAGAASEPRRGSVGEVARIFFKLGCVAFGGPAAHIAMMEDEFVTRRRWISREHFLDLIGATNLIPGPNSTEMTMHVGYERAGWPGLFAAGASFIFPAATLTGLLGWLYVRYGTLPDVEPFLVGIKPAVLAIIAGALWKLGKKAVRRWQHAAVGLGAVIALALGVSEIAAMLLGGIAGMVWLRMDAARRGAAPIGILAPFAGMFARNADAATSIVGGSLAAPAARSTLGAAVVAAAGAVVGAVPLWKLGLFFLKVGAVLYGSGYVLFAFLEGDLVNNYGWLTNEQLVDAIAIGQFTPGPVLSTATFIGFVIAGWPGAIVATIGIFLPSFLFVLVLNPLIPKMRQSIWIGSFLDAVNVAAVALMVWVTYRLGVATLVSPVAWGILALAAVALFRFKLNSAWIILGGALLGVLAALAGIA